MSILHGQFDYNLMQFWCNSCREWITKEVVDDQGHEHFDLSTIYFCDTPLKYIPYTNIIRPASSKVIKEDKFVSECGATSSKLKLRFDLVPEIFNVRVTQRWTEGAEKHGEYNYRKGLTDAKYIQERIAHLRQHLSDFLLNGNINDDNLAAIGWCVGFLMEAEQIPEGKKALLQALNVMNYAPMHDPIEDLSERAL